VSSSAALEVAVMTALAAAHDCSLSGRELALLCQKAEVKSAALAIQQS
jgi:L-arabinokinase